MGVKHPLQHHFGEVTEIFHYIHDLCESAGLYIDWHGTTQTVQLYRNKESREAGDRYIGAIQYEGSNELQKRTPSTVSLRFRRSNLTSPFKYLLENITAFRKDTNKEPFVNAEAESIAFKFTALDEEAMETLRQIEDVLKMARCI
ncbi:hypothetical protein ABEP17_04200 [Priestia flexa]|uniref:Uncharacterized protein n=2 Tax=Priestia TaxID=2800373 RepID=A0A0V8JQP6_9BACI|nr:MULTISPECIES: hypothetical protein [Bacillaceae]KSU89422.1 hypothetical protein AS180_02410 [Priestia veravalensis]KZB92954.1 hypothetical protein A2U94_03030 [Bacillus sp. VT 712]MBY6086426.1 hypothetical protein [Priestia flexa]MCA1202620.1 hypothetical protein [Priestia flexa]MCG7312678.1 hypothetical protein [Priestia flexa]